MIRIQDNFTDSASLLNKEKRHRQSPNFNPDELLENQLWIFLYAIGFNKLNIGRQCQIYFGKDAISLQSKQVDIIAESDEARFYIECSTQQQTTSKIREWIGDSALIRKHESQNIDTESKNVIYLFYSNQSLIDADKKRLHEAGIKLLDDKILQYFNELLIIYKNLAYYQFLAYLLAGQTIRSVSKEELDVPAIKCKYSGGKHCYLFGIKPSKLIPLSSVLHRKFDMNDGITNNYQRLVKKQKINDIRRFIKDKGGIFPTNIIISFDEKGEFFRPKDKINDIHYGILSLPRRYQSITIIDGQHRLFAYDGLDEADRDLIYVVAFHDMEVEKQVQTFVDINEKQTKVSASLMWDLYSSILPPDELKSRISSIVKRLNKDKLSPLFGVIEYDSADYSPIKYKITLESICTSVKSENIIGVVEGILNKNEIKFRTDDIYDLIKGYFNVIKSLDTEHWERADKTNNLLRSNQGIGALLILFKEVMRFIDNNNVFSKPLDQESVDSNIKDLVS
jgi:DNA sulfur modification protein DndB